MGTKGKTVKKAGYSPKPDHKRPPLKPTPPPPKKSKKAK